jgi:hypothetical protein
MKRKLKVLMAILIACVPAMPAASFAASSSGSAASADTTDWKAVLHELREMKQERAHDREVIRSLEVKVNQLESKGSHSVATTQELQRTDKKLEATTQQLQMTSEEVRTLQTKLQASGRPQDFSEAVNRYLGSHSFTISGAAGGQFIYDQQPHAIANIPNASENSFFFDWEPEILYRPTDWILFQGVLSAGFGNGGSGTDLSTADVQLFLNDYVTAVFGLVDQPFGDWYETQSPMWVNRFVTAPLPFGVEPVIPPGELGIQLRGGFQWGQLGQDADYTVWGGNGPNFSNNYVGAAMDSPTAVANSQTNGKSIGGRLRIYPLPLESPLGRLELGVSTYDGKWMGGNWMTSWGLDYNYFIGDLQTRGEWVQSYRHMPNGQPNDNRTGWYLQFGYFLNHFNIPGVSDHLNDIVHRFEPLIRYSGVNQRAVSEDDITGATGVGLGGMRTGLVPDFGISGSPALWAPHSREVAIGLDYWITPSIVWQNEFDIELPHAGGWLISGSGSASPIGSTPNDRAFLSQFTIGF